MIELIVSMLIEETSRGDVYHAWREETAVLRTYNSIAECEADRPNVGDEMSDDPAVYREHQRRLDGVLEDVVRVADGRQGVLLAFECRGRAGV